MILISSAVMVAFLIAVNALYVAAEFGVVSARRSRIQQLAEEGHWLAARLEPVLRDPKKLDRYVAACQVGITLSSLILGAYGEAKLAPVLAPLFEHLGGWQTATAESTATVIVLVFLTILQMILGELVPKSLALQFPTHTALFTALPLRWSLRVLGGFISFLNGTGHALLALMRIKQPEHRHIHSPEEIELLIAESTNEGLLEPEEKERLRRALLLSMREARHLMVPRARVEAIDIAADRDEIQRAISGPYTRLPVYRGRFDDIVGVLHTKDVVIQRLKTGEVGPIEHLMRPVLEVPDTARADWILALMRERRTHQAIVRTSSGAVAGIVTLEDVLVSIFGSMPDDELAPKGHGRRRR